MTARLSSSMGSLAAAASSVKQSSSSLAAAAASSVKQSSMKIAEMASKPNVEPTREHWVPDAKVTHCGFASCGARFTLTLRPHHCRRCGHVFCEKHSKLKLRLTEAAEPTNEGGANCRVCDNCWADGQRFLQQLEREQATVQAMAPEAGLPPTAEPAALPPKSTKHAKSAASKRAKPAASKPTRSMVQPTNDGIIQLHTAAADLTARDRTSDFVRCRSHAMSSSDATSDARRRARDAAFAAYEKLLEIHLGRLTVLPQWTKRFGVSGLTGDELLSRFNNTNKLAVPWDDASTAKECGQCRAPFNTFKFKHHCRLCTPPTPYPPTPALVQSPWSCVVRSMFHRICVLQT